MKVIKNGFSVGPELKYANLNCTYNKGSARNQCYAKEKKCDYLLLWSEYHFDIQIGSGI